MNPLPWNPGHPLIVAELSNAHNGSYQQALALIASAKIAGADVVKFQCYTPDELVELRGDGPAPEPWGSDGWTMRRLYEKAQTPHEWFPGLVDYCDRLGVPWFSSVFGPDSLTLLESLGCPVYKIAALDEGAGDLRDMVVATGKPIIASKSNPGGPRSGPSTVLAKRSTPWANLLLHCPPGYPQNPDHIDYEHINIGNYDGLSYHGTSIWPCVKALGAGASVIEVHFHSANQPSELEANVSLDELGFAAVAWAARNSARVHRAPGVPTGGGK